MHVYGGMQHSTSALMWSFQLLLPLSAAEAANPIHEVIISNEQNIAYSIKTPNCFWTPDEWILFQRSNKCFQQLTSHTHWYSNLHNFNSSLASIWLTLTSLWSPWLWDCVYLLYISKVHQSLLVLSFFIISILFFSSASDLILKSVPVHKNECKEKETEEKCWVSWCVPWTVICSNVCFWWRLLSWIWCQSEFCGDVRSLYLFIYTLSE